MPCCRGWWWICGGFGGLSSLLVQRPFLYPFKRILLWGRMG